jgi:hypothetical protein
MTPSYDPVYVAGLERSGTSLMFALLASHPDLAMTRRTNLWTHFFGQYGDLSQPANLDRCLSTMSRYRRIIKLDPDIEQLRRDFNTSGDRTYGRLFALLEQQYADRIGRRRWGDKSLHTERYAEPIFAAFPAARIIHMIRDPRDRYASSKTRWRRRGGIGAGTAEWLASARLAERNERRFPGRYRVVRYETLVADAEETLRDICAFLGVTFDTEMLRMRNGGRFTETGGNSSYGTRHDGVVSPSSVGRYRSVLTAEQVAFVQLLANREMLRFGYPLDEHRSSPSRRVGFALAVVPFEMLRFQAWRARDAVRDARGRPVPAYRLVPAGSAS